MKQPDAFERMVNKVVSASFPNDELLLTKLEAVNLLRRHHAKIERMVRKQLQQPDLYRVTHILIRDILAELQAMRRGKP